MPWPVTNLGSGHVHREVFDKFRANLAVSIGNHVSIVRQTPLLNAETIEAANGHCRVHRERPRYKSRTQLHVQSALASENTPDPCRCQGDRRRQRKTTS